MKKLKCAIVDDEFLARTLLKDYISKVPFLELVGDYNSPLLVSDLLLNESIDILFLDIQMPDITGLEFLRSLEKQPAVILTTAYKEYAYESYEFNVIDYLLKPFPFERFLKAVNKVKALLVSDKDSENAPTDSGTQFHADNIVIRADRKYYKIAYENLLYMEGQKAYVTFYPKEGKRITALASLKELEEHLADKQFVRIHKSFIVSANKIDSYDGSHLTIGDVTLPIGKIYRPVVDKIFGL